MYRLEDISQNVDFGPEKSKFGPKRAQNGRGYIFIRIVNINFPKVDHKIGFYNEKQQNWMDHLGDISQNVDFGPEKGKFVPKKDPK